MDTSDLLMSSQQQAEGAEQRRPGGLQIGRPGVSRWGLRPFTQLENQRILLLGAEPVTVKTPA